MSALQRLTKLAPHEVIAELLTWDFARDNPVRTASTRSLRPFAGKVLATWGEVVVNPDALPRDMEIQAEDIVNGRTDEVNLRGEELLYVGVGACILWFAQAIDECERRGVQIRSADARLAETMRKYSTAFEGETWIVRFTAAYWTFLAALLGLPTVRAIVDVEPYAQAAVEAYAHEALAVLYALHSSATDVGEKADSRYVTLVASAGLRTAIDRLRRFYQTVAVDERRSWKARAGMLRGGPFSLLRPNELPLLAARDERIERRYGSRRVDRVFEQQLSLLVQSLGFAVVAARSGERKVDLLCIAGGGGHEEGFLFLVEAKSSRRPYSLPAKDERALAEYVRDVRAAGDLPRLRFVLLVSSAAGRGLEVKLRAFEANEAIPLRFVSADALSALRSALPGPVRPREFATAVLASQPIAGHEFADRVIGDHDAIANAHVTFVRTMLDPTKAASVAGTAVPRARRRDRST